MSMVPISSTAPALGALGWKSRIRPASFRGIDFGVSSDDKEAGRSTVLHQFPQRDLPYVEDMGAAPARFVLQAFVLGADFMDRRDKLEQALLQPGPGTLVHPWYGELQVAQDGPYKIRHSADDGGMCVFTLTFVRSDAPGNPSATVNASRRAGLLANVAGSQACAAFDQAFTFAGQGAWVVNQSFALVTDAMQTVQQMMGGDMRSITSLLGAATGYDFGGLASMGMAIWSAMRSLPISGPQSGSRSGPQSGLDSANTSSRWCAVAQRDAYVPSPPHAGQGRQTIIANGNAVNVLITRLAAVEAAHAASTALPQSQAAAATLRDDLTDAVDAALDAPHAYDLATLSGASLAAHDDALAVTLADMRGHALAAVAQRALAAPQVFTVNPVMVQPWLALCWRYTGAITHEADMAARNALSHPLFTPAGPLEVLRGQ